MRKAQTGQRDHAASSRRAGDRRYEFSRYGTMIAWAKQLGLRDAVPLLEETLKQEKAADAKLSQIAMSTVNRQAA